jgi:NAD(P)-dependent dehydrogenase (short-subunit alcohol dehydrogenase family)
MTMTPTQFDPRDPRSAYPAPPFPSQPQSGTGSFQEMRPVPDHGEESYVGFGRMKGRRCLITGADSGIGRAVAIAFAREGADLAIACLHADSEDAASTREIVAREGGKALLLEADNSVEAQCLRLIEEAAEGLGGLDVLVNNAGNQVTQPSIEKVSTEQFTQTFAVNVFGTFWLTKAALAHMGPGAAIINVTSEQAFDPSPNLLDYASTKFALHGFTRALAKQLAGRGIRVNAVAPGPIWTPLQPSGGQTDEKVQHFGAGSAFGRPGQPAEVAPAFVFLATQESGYMTGETIGVTGGSPIA